MKALRAGSVFLAALLLACSPAPRRDPVERPRASPADSASSPPAAALIPPPDSSGEPGAARQRPPREGAPGSTKGTIACGKARCRPPGQVCELDEESFDWRCIRPEDAGTEDGPGRYLACDDGTDCPAGETCCVLFERNSLDYSACVKRADVDRACAAELCLRDGARCPAGRACEPLPRSSTLACLAPVGPATCAGDKPCPKDKPICVGGPQGLSCVSRGTPEFLAAKPERRWECTRQSDCHAGDVCGYVWGETEHEIETYCGKYSPGYSGSMLCDPGGPPPCTTADCKARYHCVPRAGGPPWMGIWAAR